MSNIRQILLSAFVYNVAGIPIVAGILNPTFGVLLLPMIAAAAMSLSSVSVISDALRLRAQHIWPATSDSAPPRGGPIPQPGCMIDRGSEPPAGRRASPLAAAE